MHNYITYLISVLSLLLTIHGSVMGKDAKNNMTIYRDIWGVPHIYAEKEEYGFYGLGYAQAEDRLETMLLGIHWVHGTLASIIGTDGLRSDILNRQWMHVEEAKIGWERLSPQLQKNYTFFASGLNQYMKEHPEEVPDWAPEAEPVDFVAISRALPWGMYQTSEGIKECVQGEIDVAHLINQGASNGWVLAHWKTEYGALTLLADPHTSLGNDAYYEYRMDAGALKSSGFAMGAMLWQAHNRYVSWAMTTGAPDVIDCYELDIDPNDPKQYRYDGEWKHFIVQEDTFAIRGGKPIKREFEYARINGILSPVAARQNGKAYVLCSAYMHDAGTMDETIYRMNLARNVGEVKEALELLGMFPQDILVGDSNGEIFYVRAGRVPKRNDKYDWSKPISGNTSDTEWQGIHALEDLIQIENPSGGYLQINNVAPDIITPLIAASDYTDYIFNDVPSRITSRGIRSNQVLSRENDFTYNDVLEHIFDEKWVGTDVWQRALRYALEKNPSWLTNRNEEIQRFVDHLLEFDGFAGKESIAALCFYYWRNGMWNIFPNGLPFTSLVDQSWEETQMEEEVGTVLLEKIISSVNEMIKVHGTTNVQYGDYFKISRGKQSWPIGGGTINIPGDGQALATDSPYAERTLRAYADRDTKKEADVKQSDIRFFERGSQAVRLVIFTNPLRSYSLKLYGQSDHPDSPHFDDQIVLASERRLKSTYFHKKELLDHLESEKIITISIE